MKIRIRRRDGITQTYHVRMRALKKLAPEGLFTISYEYDEGQDLFRAKKPTAWGKQPMKMLKEYPELVTLTRESGIKNVVFKPDIRTLEDKRKKKGFVGRFIPKQNIIEMSIAPGYDAWNKTAPAVDTDELAHTLLHELRMLGKIEQKTRLIDCIKSLQNKKELLTRELKNHSKKYFHSP